MPQQGQDFIQFVPQSIPLRQEGGKSSGGKIIEQASALPISFL